MLKTRRVLLCDEPSHSLKVTEYGQLLWHDPKVGVLLSVVANPVTVSEIDKC